MPTKIENGSFSEWGCDVFVKNGINVEIVNASNQTRYHIDDEVEIRNHNGLNGQTGKIETIITPSKAKAQGVLIIKLADSTLTDANFEQVVKINKRPPT